MTPRHLALGLLVAVIWGVNFVAIDLGLRDTLPLVLVALRFALVAVPLVFLVPRPDAPWRVILGIVALGRLEGDAGLAAILPMLICVAAGLSWGIGNVISRSAAVANGFGIVVWSALVVPIPVLGLSLLLDGPGAVGEAFATIGWPTIASVAFTAGLASLVGYTIWNMLLGLSLIHI